MTDRTRAWRLLTRLGSGLVRSIGAQSSIGEPVLSTGWRKPRGMTPMMVIGSSSSRTVLPMTPRITTEPALPQVVGDEGHVSDAAAGRPHS